MPGVSEDMSFLELFDVLNDKLVMEDVEPVAFDHDCREGICGSCAMMIDGRAHGPEKGTATCQLHLRKLTDGAVITVEPWRAAGFPIIKDLAVDRSAFDRIVEAGGYITAPTGAARDANEILVPKEAADAAMDAAACIGCGACVAACPNSAAQLFTAAKYSHLSLLPQGQPERYTRVVAHGGGDGAVLRLVHQPRRVRAGVPEGDLDRLHRDAEPRLRQGAVQEHPPRRPARLSSRGIRRSAPGPPPRPSAGRPRAARRDRARGSGARTAIPAYLPDNDFQRFLTEPEPRAAWVAVEDRRIVGHVALNDETAPGATAVVRDAGITEPVGFVARLLVDPSVRRTGIGRMLLAHALDAAVADGLVPVLDVVADARKAIALYESTGWVRLGSADLELPDGTSITELVYRGPGRSASTDGPRSAVRDAVRARRTARSCRPSSTARR